ncbi:hypothetical protein [uncultured Roseobacter sp.]|uniref:hypothetical protein n=1 Tax=uncultured Roseobacter sp. TaxID=114847 RepID=UPI00260EF4C5|nr:hypothetical protein [uncultured Roseobacter sp.]
MKLSLLKVTVAATLLTSPLVAEPIVVRAGEHASFTRLVMQLPDDVTWEIETGVGKHILKLSGHDDGFDTDRAFAIIPRDRLTTLSQSVSDLELSLACDCPVQTFVETSNFLVIDILDGPPLPPSVPEETPLETVSSEQAPLSLTRNNFGYGELLWRNSAEQGPSDAGTETEPALPNENEASSLIRAQTQASLLLEVGEAISAGILEGAAAEIAAPIDIQSTEAEAPIFDSSRVRAPVEETEYGNLRVTDSRDIPETENPFPGINASENCMAADRVAVATWASDAPFGKQVGKLRESLFDETGKLNEGVVLSLARMYIHFGFGAEARQTLMLAEDTAENYPELFDMAGIVDGVALRNPRVLHRFIECQPALVLWALLSSAETTDGYRIDVGAVIENLFMLPGHLRLQLGPALSEKLIDLGEVDAASIVLRNVEQVNSRTASAAPLPESKILKAQGQNEAANEVLDEAIKEDDGRNPAAVLALVDAILSSGETVPSELAGILENMAFEFRRQPEATSILPAHARVLARSGRLPEAFVALDQASQTGSDMLSSRSAVFSDLATIPEAVTFLDLYLENYNTTPNFVTPKTARLLAARLLNLGFPDMASDALSVVTGGFNIEQHRLLSARIELERGFPERAIELVSGMSDPDANRVLASAQLAIGDTEEAQKTFEVLEDEVAAAEAGWLSENWEDLLANDTPVFGQVRELSVQPTIEAIQTDGVIQQSNSILETTSEARVSLETLLSGTSLQETN